MIQRRRNVVLVIILLGAAGWFGWRWVAQTVDVAIVNASGATAQFSWQPQPFADPVTVIVGGCESKSVVLRAGESWRLEHDRLEVNSSIVDVPLFVRGVAIEIWLAPDGSSRLVSAYPVDHPVDAPAPSGCPPQAE